jgi:ketosteroid isomerase-like protein
MRTAAAGRAAPGLAIVGRAFACFRTRLEFITRMSSSNARAEEARSLNRQWMESYVRRDIGFLERHLAEDYVSTFPDGTVLDRQGEIDALKSGEIALEAMTPSEMNVRTYGDVAVITGRSTIKANVKGQPVSGDYRFTDVWVKQSGRWLAIASQVTRIAEP